MNLEDKQTISDFSDRELLELTFAAIIDTRRTSNSIESYLKSKDEDYSKHFNQTSIEDDFNIILRRFEETDFSVK